MSKTILLYLTANDTDLRLDLVNLKQFKRYHPGVKLIELFICMSEVDTRGERERYFVRRVSRMFGNCSWIVLKMILFKSNIGRDFSSVSECLDILAEENSPEDIVIVRNRSAYGPNRNGWALDYINLLNQPDVGLVGNTINFAGYVGSSYNFQPTHVQTYYYLSRLKTLMKLKPEFPGIYAVSREEAINSGEIELSRRLVEDGHTIKCINWPDQSFSKNRMVDTALPMENLAMKLKSLHFSHREAHGIHPQFFQLALERIKFFLIRTFSS